MMNIALAGNPNTGKTSLFNVLTGSYEYVGNWAGVTVEKKVGTLKNKRGCLVDLPGLYSLNPVSRDEGVATQFLLQEDFSLILNIVDASQLKRNLYLTVQLLEYGKPLLIGLNMIDVAQKRGYWIDAEKLGEKLGCRVVPIVARTGKGCQALLHLLDAAAGEAATPLRIDYGPVLEQAIADLCRRLPEDMPPSFKRWLALQFFEGNTQVREKLKEFVAEAELDRLVEQTEKEIVERTSAKSLQHHIHLVRGHFIDGVVSHAVTRTKEIHLTLSDRIDRLVTHKVLGIPFFLLFMYIIFKLTFDWLGSPLSDRLDEWINGPIAEGLDGWLVQMGVSEFLRAVVTQGIIAGVGGVLVFVPQIFILFFFISFIEDSGYMARVTMVMDKLMEAVGLNGKAFIPMIIGFGCNVPGVMAARTIEQPKERLLTILLTPLMSCSARLTIYSLFVGTFFKEHQALIVLSLYVLGIVVALLLAKLFSHRLLHSDESVFVVELPPYRVPQWLTLMRSTWEKGKGFIRKAGTFIFAGSVAIWLLGYAGPGGLNVPMDQSFLAMLGGVIAPVLAPLGFGNWQAGAALITGFLAKEVVVSTMNIIYAVSGSDQLEQIIPQFFTPLGAYTFMAFALLYVPCLATVAVIRKETGSAKWTWFAVGYCLAVAYLVALAIHVVGRLLGFH